MNYKKSMIIIMLAIFLFAIAAVSASDVNDAGIASGDDGQIELSQSGEVETDNLQTGEEQIVTQTDNDENLSSTDELDVGGVDEATYSNLSDEISAGGNVELLHDYYRCSGGESTIAIHGDYRIIDGRGAVIDMAGSTIRAFNVAGYGVTIKNLTIKNANFTGGGGTIDFTKLGIIENCNFVNNTASYLGGAVNFAKYGTVTNCNFDGNTASYAGGAVYFNDRGTVTNCNFTNNKAINDNGSAILVACTCTVKNCNFINNTAFGSGAVYIYDCDNKGSSTITNCNFADNSAFQAGAIHSVKEGTVADTCIFKTSSDSNFNIGISSPTLNIDNFTTFYGSGEKLTFDLKTNSSIPVTNGNILISVYYKNNNSWVGDYTCLSGEGWTVDLPAGSYYAIFDTEYAEFQPINRTITIMPDTFWVLNYTINNNNNPVINLTNDFYFDLYYDTDFVNGIVIGRPVTINGNGYTIDANGKARIFQITSDNVVLENITFVNGNTTGSGGAVYFNNYVKGTVINCNFTNNTALRGGGAVYFNENSEGNVKNCNFINNSATNGNGGAVYWNSLNGKISDCNFTQNSVNRYYDKDFEEYLGGEGGAIYWRGIGGEVYDCNFTNNTAYNAGAILWSEDYSVVYDCNFINNHADNKAGALLCLGEGDTVSNCNFTYNSALKGGAVYWWYINGNINNNCIFINNFATEGGAIFFDDESYGTEVDSCIFYMNNATNGGAIYVNERNVSVISCEFNNNTATNGGAVFSHYNSTVTNCNFTNNNAINGDGGAVYFYKNVEGNVTNCSFTNNSATYGGAIYFNEGSNGRTINCNFTDNSAAYGGAIIMVSGNVTNCSFTDNKASEDGGGIWIYSGNVTNCNFTNNKATGFYSYGGAVYFLKEGNVTNCSFTNNSASENGGAIHFAGTGNVTNCNFTNNKASEDGGAIRFSDTGTVTNCNFTGNTASGDGGAIWISSGTVTNCNFVDNKATGDYGCGGAVYFFNTGSVSNCNFADNTATYGGAVYFNGNGEVTNCNFTGNNATGEGGAINMGSGSVSNCNFTDNTATYDGGAVYFSSTGTVSNCNFTNNKATGDYARGGAVYFYKTGTVTNCNFTGNNATTGSAIYFWSTSASKTVSNSCFLNNRANAEALDIVKNDNNITITFTGHNNLLNAIYSEEDAEVAFTNVTYWGANGITTINTPMSGSNKEAGQNITVVVVVNDVLVLNEVKVTDENGRIVLDISAGENYYISARHDADSYYTEAEKTISNNINVNIISQTTTNKTVNITAKSNIPQDVVKGKLLFIVPNTDPINATYAGNGTWWAVYTFDNAGDYNVNASYIGLDNVTINNATISIRFDASVEVNNKTLDLLIGDTFTVVATTTPEGLKVSFVPDDSGVYSIDENGNVIALRDGEGSILIKVGDDGIYAKNSTIVNVTVSKVPTEITANDVTTTYNSNKDLVITLKDSTGKALSGVKVTVDLNGAKTYTTDSNGQVKVPTKGLAPKTYTVKIAFNGNTKYVKSVKEVKVTVKKATPKITAKKKTFKATTKTKKYTITLKDNTGKAIKNAKVTLKVNGKTYKATTNSKGKATFKITKLNKKGTYKATVTYKGNKYYNKATKKVKITVKASKTKKSTFKTVSQGSKDTKTVKKIQQALKDNGYYLTYQGHYLKVDGKYESCTVRSVKEFQHDKGLKVTGKVDEKTAKKLKII